MNAFQRCPNTSDAVPLYLPQKLYLKPIARLNVSIHITQKILGKTIKHYEIMEKLKDLIKPDEFVVLKVTKTTLEVIEFDAEVDHRNKLIKVLDKLHNKTIKLKDFTDLMGVKAVESRNAFPVQHEWDSYFRDAKDMNEMKPGERPDTIHISNLPTKWFIGQNKFESLPSDKLVYKIFEKYGPVRQVDIPICDPYRSQMKSHITGIQDSSFEKLDFFEAYVQYKDYIGFKKAMESLKGMKLMCKIDGEANMIDMFVDFDKSKHLSEATIRRRDIVRDRLILKQKEKEAKEKEIQQEIIKQQIADSKKKIDMKNEKEKRRREREEKRKAKILAELKTKGSVDINDKIAKEEKKLLKVQRRLESIRLVEELFKRIKIKVQKNPDFTPTKNCNNSELSKLKSLTEHEVKSQREKLHHAIEGRVILKSIIAKEKIDDDASSSTSSLSLDKDYEDTHRNQMYHPQPMNDMNWYNYLPQYNGMSAAAACYSQFPYYHPHHSRGGRGMAGPSRLQTVRNGVLTAAGGAGE
ncbi:PREDICTED: A-kinase anchor protein 17A-like isoform X2 [Nicrophorus vespilloides]|uniref:A-kinase anchor protein 17A-like isoform X2 n=1 Tax=Nicrophorus vespilloides TaxID=110193 RepID=A0ABM1N991_NICVS|nr:PREDICTED: A-kinase anchor protein 17A-like isoform X2 [Nicrophorus vespilloides]